MFRRCAATGVFDVLLEGLAELVERDRPADMINGTVVRARHCAAGVKRRAQEKEAPGRSRGGFSTKLHARCDAQGRPLAFVPTPGQAHDVQGFRPLMRMAADRIATLVKGYGADAIRDELARPGVEAVIPAKSNRRRPAPTTARSTAGATASSSRSTNPRTGGKSSRAATKPPTHASASSASPQHCYG